MTVSAVTTSTRPYSVQKHRFDLAQIESHSFQLLAMIEQGHKPKLRFESLFRNEQPTGTSRSKDEDLVVRLVLYQGKTTPVSGRQIGRCEPQLVYLEEIEPSRMTRISADAGSGGIVVQQSALDL